MKLIKTEDAVGCMLCHDITQIIPGVVKDAVFRKGHVVTKGGYSGSPFRWKRASVCVGKTRRDAS